MTYLLLSFMVCTVSLLIISNRIAPLSPSKLNIITWCFYFSLIIQSVISSVIVVNFWEDHYRISRQLMDPMSRTYGWLAIQWVMLGLPIGLLISMLCFGKQSGKKTFERYINKPIESFSTRNNRHVEVGLLCLTFMSVLTVAYVIYTVGFLPQMKLFGNASAFLAEVREDVGRGFTGSTIIRNIFGLTILPILSYVWFAYFSNDRKLKHRLLFYITTALSIVMVTFNLAKAPLIFYCIGFLFIKVYINGGVSLKGIFFFGILSLLAIVGFYYLTFDSLDILHLFSPNTGIGGRILLAQSMGVYFSFDIFPSIKEHIGFSSISGFINNIFSLTDSERSARILMEVLNPKGVSAGVAGVMNSLFIAEAWANFGLIGVLISPIVVGFYIGSIYMFFITSPKTPAYLGLFAYLSYRIPVVGSFNEFIYNPIHVLLILFFGSIMLFSTKKQR